MPKVLFVDDEPYVLDAYLRMLRNSTFQCYTLSDSRQLFEHPALSELDIIVVDQQMPWVTGTEILLQLQQRLPRIKRVLISGDLYFVQGFLATKTIDAALQKPFTKALLLDCLLTLS
ncbi:MAG: response regulator [Shewanella sp.]|jgi:FixJ family two-component response regulator|uniref:response regulator n=1 Tax=Shewanella sp. TaxID=50422 RepID=UPI0030030767|tara:strand:- start:2188 stop:2538 length:351 start_codon:yes stop_codon:yes gene_type:complete